jgi:uncharacterized membrane protein YkvA (DUF1232 family)
MRPSMISRLRFVRRVVVDLPRQVRLAYCLMREPRVPITTKLMFASALTLIATPVVDIPIALPVVGELDAIALTLLALRLFIAACPSYVVNQQKQLLLEQRSRFDEDVRKGERVALMLYRRFRHPDDVEIDSAVRHQHQPETAPGAST